VSKRSVALVSTGGTIEKTYDPFSGVLSNHVSVLDVMLASLDLHGVSIHRVPLMNKDSLEMTDADHERIAQVAHEQALLRDGVSLSTAPTASTSPANAFSTWVRCRCPWC